MELPWAKYQLGDWQSAPSGVDATVASFGPHHLHVRPVAQVIAAGASHTCALQADGALVCFGDNVLLRSKVGRNR